MSLTFLVVIMLVLCGSAVIISEDWRWRLLALGLQYLVVAILMAFEVFFALGIVRLASGAVTVLILFQTFRNMGAERVSGEKDGSSLSNIFMRVACVLLALVVSFGLAQTYPLPNLSKDVVIGAYWLVLSSISSMVITQEVHRIGFALLMLELAAALIASVTIETANLARFLLASLASIVLALAVGFLITLQGRAATSGEVES